MAKMTPFGRLPHILKVQIGLQNIKHILLIDTNNIFFDLGRLAIFMDSVTVTKKQNVESAN